MAKASDVLKVAVSQIGVCEKPAGSNRTKYGKEFGLNGEPWCAIFLWWCFNHGGAKGLFPHNASAAYAQDEIVSRCGGSWVMKKNTRKATRKAYLKKAKPGDVVCFDFGRMDAWRSHIGIVEKVSGDYIICIEGNTSKAGSQSNGGMVCRQRRLYTSVCSAARPAFSGSTPSGGLDVDGELGPLTLKAFQTWLGCKQTGKLDTTTIKAFRKRMNIPVSGKWDKHTQSALQRYLNLRNDAGLVVDGEVGYLTVCALQEYLNKVVK